MCGSGSSDARSIGAPSVASRKSGTTQRHPHRNRKDEAALSDSIMKLATKCRRYSFNRFRKTLHNFDQFFMRSHLDVTINVGIEDAPLALFHVI